jgi:hypothetical protein
MGGLGRRHRIREDYEEMKEARLEAWRRIKQI